MGLFYAFLRDASLGYPRYLITFISREVADEWWRMISTPPSPYVEKMQRISPQLFFQNDIYSGNVASFLTKMTNTEKFSKNMFFTVVNGKNPTNIIRPANITDHISGAWYFIRSTADPWSHWYLRIKGECLVCGDVDCDVVHASSEYRTRFCVRVRNAANDPQLPKDFVMIGSDKITIAAPKGYILYINDAEDLKATKGYEGETDLLFEGLKNRFISRAEKQVNGEIWEYVESVERGSGEVWELVN